MRSNRPYVQLDPAVIEQARQMDSEACGRQCILHQRTRQLEDFQRQMVLVVERFRRRFCP